MEYCLSHGKIQLALLGGKSWLRGSRTVSGELDGTFLLDWAMFLV